MKNIKLIAVIFAFSICACIATRTVQAEVPVEPKLTRLDTSVSVVLPVDPQSPTVKITYFYVSGSKNVTLQLPTDKQMAVFSAMTLLADGKSVPRHVNTALERFFMGRSQVLSPGEKAELIVPLDKVFKLPQGWKMLEVIPFPNSLYKGGVQDIRIFADHPQRDEFALHTAAVTNATATTLAFTAINQHHTWLELAPVGTTNNPIHIVKPNGEEIKHSEEAGSRPVRVVDGMSQTMRVNMDKVFMAHKLTEPGLYRIYWKVKEARAPDFLLLKE